MNIVRIENVKDIDTLNGKIDIKSNQHHTNESVNMVILSADDINNDNSMIALKGYSIRILVIPKKYRYTFYETKLGSLIKSQFDSKCNISYY